MIKSSSIISFFILIVTLSACTHYPEGSSVSALPGSNKSHNSFEQDSFNCQDYAKQQSGNLNPNQVKEEVTGEQAFIGALIGGILGAAIGSRPQDAAIGALTGALFGGLSGNNQGDVMASDIQYDYDKAYINCMYSAGHKVPAKNIIVIEKTQQLPQQAAPQPKATTPYGVPADYRPQ